MTHEETIRALDNLIVYLNSAICEVKLSRHFKDYVIGKLREINVSNATIHAVANVEIEEYDSNSLYHHIMELQHLEKERIERNKQSIQSMINILIKEQEHHKRILEDESQKKNVELQKTAIAEQKKGNKIMRWTLFVSVVAIIISIISLIVAICK